MTEEEIVESTARVRMAKMFGELGLSLRTIFPDPEENLLLYRHHRWDVVKKKNHHIIHAVPKGDCMENSFWEEWYSIEGGPVIHHILFCKEPPVPYHDLYEPPKRHDGLHPEEIYGRTWYVIEDPMMRAWAVQQLFLK